MQTKTLTSASLLTLLTLLNNVTAHPTVESMTDIVLDKRTATDPSFDKAACFWKSDAVIEVQWAITIPQVNGIAPDKMKDNFFGSTGKNSACRGPSVKGFQAVGEKGTTALIYFETSDFCTAFQMTNVIKAATGNAQATACIKTKYKSGFGADPGPDNLLPEIPELGEPEAIPRRAVIPVPSVMSAAPAPAPAAASSAALAPAPAGSQPTDAEMAGLLKLAAGAPHADIIKALNGPSAIDHA